LATGSVGLSGGSQGTQVACLATGGTTATPAFLNMTEEFSEGSSVAQEGQVWYNSSSQAVKGFGQIGTGAWASGGTMNTVRYSYSGFGTQTASIAAIGGPGSIVKSESYDGSTWTELNDCNTPGDSSCGIGSTTAGLINARAGGPALLVETYDGTSWSEVNNMNDSSRGKRTDAGTFTAALCVGGENHPAVLAETELWDGTCWTAVAGDLNNGRSTQDGGTGTQTAAIVAGGTPPVDSPLYDYAEEWDGTSWTEVADLNVAKAYGVAFGVQTNCLYGGGRAPSVTGTTEQWNGTSWTEVGDLGTGVEKAAGGGTAMAGIISGGYTTTAVGTAQEWNVPTAIKTFTAS